MKNLSLKIKLLIAGAIVLILFLLGISIGQLVSLHNKQKQINNLNKRLDNLVKQMAGTNPPSTATISFKCSGVTAEMQL